MQALRLCGGRFPPAFLRVCDTATQEMRGKKAAPTHLLGLTRDACLPRFRSLSELTRESPPEQQKPAVYGRWGPSTVLDTT